MRRGVRAVAPEPVLGRRGARDHHRAEHGGEPEEERVVLEPGEPLVERERSWKGPRAEIARLKREIEALASAEELAEIAEAAERPVAEAREELRYRIADRVNDALKRAPGVHTLMKAWLDRRRNRR